METATDEEYMLKGSVRAEVLGFEESIRMLGRPAGCLYRESASILSADICPRPADVYELQLNRSATKGLQQQEHGRHE
ncbi:hypothetical protein ColTof3_08564 [Colletotrichum tofieldiae]|nr:hypothetical protein ColTof3_08564 [Colletotrichum tofieldiae]